MLLPMLLMESSNESLEAFGISYNFEVMVNALADIARLVQSLPQLKTYNVPP